MIKNIITFILISFNVFFLSSCYDKLEIEDRDFVLTIAIDKHIPIDKHSNEDRFLVTVSIPNPIAVTNLDDNQNKILSTSGKTIIEAINNISTLYGVSLDFSQSKVLILGQQLLEDANLFKETLDVLQRNRRLSKKSLFLATEGRGVELINSKIENVNLLGYFLSEYFNSNNYTSSINLTLLDVIKSIEKFGDTIIPIVNVSDGKLSLSSNVVIKDFRWLEIVTSDIMDGLLLLSNGYKGNYYISIPHKDFYVPLQVTGVKRTSTFNKKNNELYYYIDLSIVGSINEFSFDDDTLLNNDISNELEDLFSSTIKENLSHTFKYFYKNIYVDTLNLIGDIKKNNYELFLFYELGNSDTAFFDKITLILNIDVLINSIGSTI